MRLGQHCIAINEEGDVPHLPVPALTRYYKYGSHGSIVGQVTITAPKNDAVMAIGPTRLFLVYYMLVWCSS